MFCPNCGNKMNDSSNFCTECGWKKNKQIFKGFDFSKKYMCIAGIVFVVLALFVLIKPKGKVYSFKDIARVKLVTEYNDNTTIDQMDTVTFGSYPQNDVKGKSTEPVEWIVLDRQGDKALLLSKYILKFKQFNAVGKNLFSGKVDTWESCDLREWLNDYFFDKVFNDIEKIKILTTNVFTNNSVNNGLNDSSNTKDSIFCLSNDEIIVYFNQTDMHSDNKRLATRGTIYAKATPEWSINVNEDNGWNNGNSEFWLRSPGPSGLEAAIVLNNGSLFDKGAIMGGVRDYGVRPALWVNIE